MTDDQVLIYERVLDDIYVALHDAYERLPNGTINIKRCLNFLEIQKGYRPPKGYNNEAIIEKPKRKSSR